ncbi:hypothetical protein QBE52_03790 [Clostridiaceae bacterium 35-E11]
MEKKVIESHYNSTFKSLIRDEKCAFCPIGCKTHCLRPTNKVDIEQSKATKDQTTHSQAEKKRSMVKSF